MSLVYSINSPCMEDIHGFRIFSEVTVVASEQSGATARAFENILKSKELLIILDWDFAVSVLVILNEFTKRKFNGNVEYIRYNDEGQNL